MSVVLQPRDSVNGISCHQMKDGQLGVIVYSSISSNIGKVVQMLRAKYAVSRDTILLIGGTAGDSWSDPLPDFKVRLLEPGDLIEVVSNH